MKDHVGFTRAVIMTLAAIFFSVGFFPHMAHAAPLIENSTDSYKVEIPGDSLSRIAVRLCGDSRQWKTIARANGIATKPFWVYLTKTYTIPCAKKQPTTLTNVTSAVLPSASASPTSVHAPVGWKNALLSWIVLCVLCAFPILSLVGIIIIIVLFIKLRRAGKDAPRSSVSVVPTTEIPEPPFHSSPATSSRKSSFLGLS